MSAPVLNDDGLAVVFDRVTGSVLTCAVPTAVENVGNGQGRFVHGSAGEPLEEAEVEALRDAPIALSEEDTLPLPLPSVDVQVLTAERDTALDRAIAAEAGVVTLQEVVRLLTDQIAQAAASAGVTEAVDDLADVRTEPGDSPEKLAKIEAKVDAANADAKVDPLDHDANGKKGGSKPRTVRSPEEQAERDAVIAELKTKGITYFAGATTAKLWEVLAAG